MFVIGRFGIGANGSALFMIFLELCSGTAKGLPSVTGLQERPHLAFSKGMAGPAAC